MPSPTRSLRRSPPRRPLHERSDSHVNEISQPTVRVIGDSNAKIYASTPFPTQPSQILSPNGRKRQSVFEDTLSVSDQGAATATPEEQGPQVINPSKGKENAASKYNHGFESELPITSPDLPPALFEKRKKAEATVPVVDKGKQRVMDYGIDEERISDEIIELPSVPSRRHSGAETHDSSHFETERSEYSRSQGVTTKSSDHSLSSAESNDTVIRYDVQSPPPRGSYTAFPPSSRLAPSASTPWRSTLNTDNNSSSPISSISPTLSVSSLSPTAPNFPTSNYRDSFRTEETRESLEDSIDRVPSLQYAVVRPPIASGSWAKSSTISISKRAVRMNDGDETKKWSPHLSMVQSEGTGDRSSSSTRHTALDTTSSVMADRSSASSVFPTLPVPAFIPQRDSSGSTIRVVGEESDVITDMPSPNLHSYNSGFPSVVSADPRRGSTITTRPGSRGSFLRDSIPAWARYELFRTTT